jgi:serine/threonine protein kinase/formylglycine-generating enzyme required for sulfatase activity
LLCIGDAFVRAGVILLAALEEEASARRRTIARSSPFEGDDPILERYEDRGPIGRGGMGEVRRVYDRELDRLLAMKILSHDLVDDATARARFIAEARVTAGLDHPGIVAVHAHGTLSDGRVWFTMREVRGRTLSDVIEELHFGARDGAWPTGERGPSLHRVIDSFRRICDAVAYAHSAGVVHRDIKPSNLMIGEFGEAQVMDWGLAKQIDGRRDSVPPDTDGFVTQVGDVIGTPCYMAPEQARGDLERMGPRSDVWALGAVLRTILTNKAPVEGPSHAVLAAILLNQIKPIASVIRSGHAPIPRELITICERAMSHAPEQRYADAGALAADVGAWLEGALRRQTALAIVREARELEPRIEAHRREAAALRAEAQAILARIPTGAPAEQKYDGWAKEDRARELDREAALAELEWRERLRSALNSDPDLPDAHELLAEFYRGRLLDAEARRDVELAAQCEVLLRTHDRGKHEILLAGQGAVTLHTDPPGAVVTLYRYVEEHRRLVPTFVRELGRTPVVAAALPHGSYLLVAEIEGRPPVRYPVLVERGAHWDGIAPGEREAFPIPIPTHEELAGDLLYVPAGWFSSGGDAQAVESLPRRKVWVDGYLVGKFPVTNAEYIAFLDALVDEGDEEEALRCAPRAALGAQAEDEQRLAFERDERGHFLLSKDERGVAWQASWPISLIDWRSALAYARRSGCRLLDELEWEKAARGVDARIFATGNFIDPSWARMIGGAEAPGRASVHDYPSDESPYGVRGTIGNVREWCGNVWTAEGPRVDDGRLRVELADEASAELRAARGGAWHSVPELTRAAGRFAAEPQHRFAVLGFRLVRPYPR